MVDQIVVYKVLIRLNFANYKLLGFIFDNIIRTDKVLQKLALLIIFLVFQYNFFHTEVIEEDVYYFKKNEQQNRKSLTELVSMKVI